MKTRLFILLLIIWKFSSAQNCIQNFNEGQKLYANGLFQSTLETLSPCLGNYPSEQLEIRALELMAKSATMLGQKEKALTFIEEIYRLQPFYTDELGLNAEYTAFLNTFRPQTSWRFSLSAGFTEPDILITEYYSFAGTNVEPESYNSSLSFTANGKASYHLGKNVFASLGLQYFQTHFSRSEIILDYQRASSTENYQWLAVPLSVEYVLGHSKWQPYLNLGWAPSLLLAAEGDLSITPLPPDRPSGFIGVPVEEKVDLRFQRQHWQQNILAGAGIRYQWSQFSVNLSFQYWLGMDNLVDESQRYTREDLIRELAYIPDDFWLNQIMLQIGVSYSILEPKRLNL